MVQRQARAELEADPVSFSIGNQYTNRKKIQQTCCIRNIILKETMKYEGVYSSGYKDDDFMVLGYFIEPSKLQKRTIYEL